MKCFVINLDQDRDRLEWMERECARTGIELRRFAACHGDLSDSAFYDQFYDQKGQPHAPLSKGEIGCYASHLEIMQLVVDEKISEPVLVLEDDIRFRDNFEALLNNLNQLPAGWDIIRLSQPVKSAYIPVQQLGNDTELVRYWKVPTSTGAYLISQGGARKFLGAYPRRMRPVDQDLRCVHEHGLETYGIIPTPVERDIFDSSIDRLASGRKKAWRLRQTSPRPLNKSSVTAYRMQTFGPALFFRASLRNWAISARKKAGRRPREQDYRLPPSPEKSTVI